MIKVSNIEAAYGQVDPIFLNTPQYRSEPLSELLGCELVIKDECRNPIGSFKGRGVDWWMRSHPEIDSVVCASAGNFGQAVAYVGRNLEKKVTVFAAETANPVKIAAMRRLGADVVLVGQDFDDAKAAASGHAQESQLIYLEDGREAGIAEGAGTIGVELSRLPRSIDILYLPIGNGALSGGVATYLKAIQPSMSIVGVCAEMAPSMALSLKQQQVVSTASAATIADGIAIRLPIPESLPPLEATLDEVVLVSEEEIIAGMRAYFQHENLVTEPAGAVSMGAALKFADQNKGKRVCTLACGANIDPQMRADWLF